ncbi:MAG: hypothetical protein HQ556_05250 [Candidatus Marinimicrobia bacterium]|nr:hypothetical protein [Candidatus Neomarinimicrobiota bacterium]
MQSFRSMLVVILLATMQSCLDIDLFHSEDEEDKSETETSTMSIDLDRYIYSFTAGQNPGETVKIPHETQTLYETDIELAIIDISSAATMDLSYEGSTIKVLTSDNAEISQSIEAIIVYEDSNGVFMRAHSLHGSSVLTFTQRFSDGFSGRVHGFFMHELCEDEEIEDLDFTIIFESESSKDTLSLNVIENMVSGNSSYLQSFSQQTSDGLYFDYTLSIYNSPYYGNITPLAIVTVRDADQFRFTNAHVVPAANHLRENKVLREMEVRVFGLSPKTFQE